jgi:hypothetical protein
MAKRFTDSRKWDDDWFLALDPAWKLAWIYILDKCNHAGIYKHASTLEQCCLGFELHPENINEILPDRVKILKDNKWFIEKFITFQYGELNESVNCHKSVISELLKEGINPSTLKQQLNKGCSTLKDKNKDKDKDTIESIRIDPLYKHIDINRELLKMDQWLAKNPGRHKTPTFIRNWLNKIEAPVAVTRRIPS